MSEDAVNSEKITTRSLIKQYFVRWRLLLLAAVLFAIAVLLWAHNIPLEYTGTAIFERRKDPITTVSVRDYKSLSGGSEAFGVRKETLRHDLAGRDAVEEAIEQLGLTKGMERDVEGNFTSKGQGAKQNLIQQFSKDIKTKWEVSSDQIDLVSVSFTHSDPLLAEQMPNMLVANYITRVIEQAAARLKDSKEFLQRQVDNCDNTLAELIGERIEFEIENAGALPESAGALHESIIQTRADLDTERLRNEVAVQVQESLQGLEQSITGSAEDPNEPQQIIMGPNPELARLEGELRQAKNTLDQYLVVRRMKEIHPDVQTIQREITRLEERIQETDPMAVASQVYGRSANNPALAIELLQTKATVVGTQGGIDRLENRLKSYQFLLNNFGPLRREYQEITDKIDKKQAELERWEGRLTATQMALAAEVAKRRIHLNAVQAALKQYLPSEPDLWKVLGIAVMGGLAFGGFLLFLAIRMDQSVITPEQAAKGFGIPVYGFVGVIMTPRTLFVRFLKRWVVLPIVSLLLMAALGLLTFSLTLRLQYPEEYKKWRENEVGYLKTHANQIWSDVRETLPNPFD